MPNHLTPEEQQIVRDYNRGYHLGYTDQIKIGMGIDKSSAFNRGLEQGWEDRLEDEETEYHAANSDLVDRI